MQDGDANKPNDEFYIGWQPAAAPIYARFSRKLIVGLLIALPLVAAAVGGVQARFDEQAVFEYGVYKSFRGILHERPLPMLQAIDEKRGAGATCLLVGLFKFGLPEFARGHDGHLVEFNGSLIYRKNQRMIEMNDRDSFRVIDEKPVDLETAQVRSLGKVELTGEIIDTKCFFGVMRPGYGRVHRACVIRCLSGGVPPGFRVLDAQGGEVIFLLAGPVGASLDLDIRLAGVEVTVAGEVELHQSYAVLRAESIDRN